VFASNAARDAAVTAPAEGNFAFTKDTNSLWYYDGAAWVASGATGDIEGVTAGVGISGGGTSGTVTVTNSMATAITTAGDTLYGTGSGTFSRLGIGTAGQVLQVNSGATAPEWATPAGGSTFAGVSLKKSTAQTVSTSTFTALTFDQENYDTNTYHDNSTNNTRITIPSGKAGYYQLSGSVVFGGNATGSRGLELRKNGSSLYYLFFAPGLAANDAVYAFANAIQLSVADYLEIFVFQSSGGNLPIEAGATLWQASYLGA
jgi:hypothetical protein